MSAETDTLDAMPPEPVPPTSSERYRRAAARAEALHGQVRAIAPSIVGPPRIISEICPEAEALLAQARAVEFHASDGWQPAAYVWEPVYRHEIALLEGLLRSLSFSAQPGGEALTIDDAAAALGVAPGLLADERESFLEHLGDIEPNSR